MLVAGWDTPLKLLAAELAQREYEGYAVPERIRTAVAQLHDRYDAFNEAKLLPLWQALDQLPRQPDFPYIQPDDLEAIREQRPDGPRRLNLPYGNDELLDRLHGAVDARAVAARRCEQELLRRCPHGQ